MLHKEITNKEVRERLKQFPDNAIVTIEYCDINSMEYDEETNIIYIN